MHRDSLLSSRVEPERPTVNKGSRRKLASIGNTPWCGAVWGSVSPFSSQMAALGLT